MFGKLFYIIILGSDNTIRDEECVCVKSKDMNMVIFLFRFILKWLAICQMKHLFFTLDVFTARVRCFMLF